jgi:hypothetical protein
MEWKSGPARGPTSGTALALIARKLAGGGVVKAERRDLKREAEMREIVKSIARKVEKKS